MASSSDSSTPRGEAWVWFSGLGLIIGLGMVIGLLTLVLMNGATVFWAPPVPVAQIDGRATQVLWFKAPQESQSRYDAVRVWVDQKTCVPLQAEYMEGKAVSKRLSMPAASLRKSGNYWYAEQAEMRDLKEGTRTTLRILGVTHAKELPGRYFDPNAFYLGN